MPFAARTAGSVLLGALGLAGTANAQLNSSMSTQREAQRILAFAVDAMGGADALQHLRQARIELSSRLLTEGQGAGPDSGRNEQPASRVIVEYGGSRGAFQTFNGENPNFRVVTGDSAGMWAHFSAGNTVSAVEPAAAVAFFERVTLSPTYMLEWLDRPEMLRSLGTLTHEGREHHALAYADPTGRQLTLLFDAVTKLPVRIETVRQHAQHGDQVVSVVFSDYRPIEEIQIPHHLVRLEGDELAAETMVSSVRLGGEPDLALFERPADATEGQPIQVPPSGPRELTVEEVAAGVYMIPNASPGYNVMYVTYDDGILVLETPVSPQVSKAVVRTIRDRHPNLRIRWALPTHYHFDHSGGIYGFLDEGVTILTTEGNRAFMERTAAAHRTIGRLTQTTPVTPRVETFRSHHVIGEGTRRVELIDVGPNPHADEIVVAYLPGIKVLFVADLYSFQGNVTAANQNALAFADRLEALNLDFDSIIPVHGQRATAEQFWESIRQGREQNQAGG